MNFTEFKAWREGVLQRQQPIRLDCLNPFIAMNFTHAPASAAPSSLGAALDAWAGAMGVETYRARAIAVEGVRAALRSLFAHIGKTRLQLWLPEDVYPFYHDAAKERISKGRIGLFRTLPKPDFEPLDAAGPEAVAVLTNPVSPLGRYLAQDEIEQILSWLGRSRRRLLVIDAVYAYRSGFDAGTRRLFETGQVFVLHSLSKAWLQRGLFGAVLPPADPAHECLDIFEPPSPEAAGTALASLARTPHHPEIQQALFAEEWTRLAEGISKMTGRDFIPPASGYLAPVPINHQAALEKHHSLVVPASVFGSQNPDLSIVSCLFQMKGLYGSRVLQ